MFGIKTYKSKSQLKIKLPWDGTEHLAVRNCDSRLLCTWLPQCVLWPPNARCNLCSHTSTRAQKRSVKSKSCTHRSNPTSQISESLHWLLRSTTVISASWPWAETQGWSHRANPKLTNEGHSGSTCVHQQTRDASTALLHEQEEWSQNKMGLWSEVRNAEAWQGHQLGFVSQLPLLPLYSARTAKRVFCLFFCCCCFLSRPNGKEEN